MARDPRDAAAATSATFMMSPSNPRVSRLGESASVATAAALPDACHPAASTSAANFGPAHVPAARSTEVLIEKLAKDNEALVAEVTQLDAQLRKALEEKAALEEENRHLLQEHVDAQMSIETAHKLVSNVEEQEARGKQEREEQTQTHKMEHEFLSSIFKELEAQIALARTEARAPRTG